MLGKQMIDEQFGYNKWANGRILEKALLVNEEQLMTPAAIGERSLYEILFHLVHIERVWRMMAQNSQVDPRQLPTPESLPTIQAIADFWIEEEAALGAYLAGIDDPDLAEALTITRWDGLEMTFFRWQLLQHLFMHSMQHRSEAAVLLTQFGHSPGNIDMLFYLGD